MAISNATVKNQYKYQNQTVFSARFVKQIEKKSNIR